MGGFCLQLLPTACVDDYFFIFFVAIFLCYTYRCVPASLQFQCMLRLLLISYRSSGSGFSQVLASACCFLVPASDELRSSAAPRLLPLSCFSLGTWLLSSCATHTHGLRSSATTFLYFFFPIFHLMFPDVSVDSAPGLLGSNGLLGFRVLVRSPLTYFSARSLGSALLGLRFSGVLKFRRRCSRVVTRRDASAPLFFCCLVPLRASSVHCDAEFSV